MAYGLRHQVELFPQVSTYKYLGVTIDEKLHWSDQINFNPKQTDFIRKLGQFKTDKTLITLFYKSVIESTLSFCITCWGDNSSLGDRMKVDDNYFIRKIHNPSPPSG